MPSTFEGAGVQGDVLQQSHARVGGPEVALGPTPARPAEHREPESELVVEELLVEDISIDGMCGVY